MPLTSLYGPFTLDAGVQPSTKQTEIPALLDFMSH